MNGTFLADAGSYSSLLVLIAAKGLIGADKSSLVSRRNIHCAQKLLENTAPSPSEYVSGTRWNIDRAKSSGAL